MLNRFRSFSGDPLGDRLASWTCGTDGSFTTPQPDRTGCTEEWVDGIADLINNNTNAVDIAGNITDELDSVENEPISGGGILLLSDLIKDMTDLHMEQTGSGGEEALEANRDYTNLTFAIIDSLLDESLGWKEIPEDASRHSASSGLFEEVLIFCSDKIYCICNVPTAIIPLRIL